MKAEASCCRKRLLLFPSALPLPVPKARCCMCLSCEGEGRDCGASCCLRFTCKGRGGIGPFVAFWVLSRATFFLRFTCEEEAAASSLAFSGSPLFGAAAGTAASSAGLLEVAAASTSVASRRRRDWHGLVFWAMQRPGLLHAGPLVLYHRSST